MAEAQEKTESKPASKVVVPRKADWKGRLAAAAIYCAIRMMAWTIRFRFDEDSEFMKQGKPGPVIFCVWHNRLFLSPVVYEKWQKRLGMKRSMAGLVSASRDGGMLAAIFEKFGMTAVRGSTSRRGAQALLEMTSQAEKGLDLSVTPDGPRGPCYTVQHGVVSLASVTGVPTLPVSFKIGWKISLGSWDRFQIPLPFSRCDIKVGGLLHVDRDISKEKREEARQELERRMQAITED